MSLNGERFTHDFIVYHRKPTKERPTQWHLFDDLLETVYVTGNQLPGVSVMGSGADMIPLKKGSRAMRIFPACTPSPRKAWLKETALLLSRRSLVLKC